MFSGPAPLVSSMSSDGLSSESTDLTPIEVLGCRSNNRTDHHHGTNQVHEDVESGGPHRSRLGQSDQHLQGGPHQLEVDVFIRIRVDHHACNRIWTLLARCPVAVGNHKLKHVGTGQVDEKYSARRARLVSRPTLSWIMDY